MDWWIPKQRGRYWESWECNAFIVQPRTFWMHFSAELVDVGKRDLGDWL
jgi:hypothetical protein